MSISVTCPCGQRLTAKDEHAGRRLKCPACGGAVLVPPAEVRPVAAPRARRLSWLQLQNAYNPMFDINDIPPEQRRRLARHRLASFPTPVAILLHYLTFCIFSTIFCGLKHSRLPVIRSDDFSAGKAIGFLFIPFFNLYWVFVFWLRLADRINFQFRLRGRPAPVSRGLILTSVIFIFIPYLGGLVNYLILVPIMLGQIQSANNWLAREQEEEEEADDEDGYPEPTGQRPRGYAR